MLLILASTSSYRRALLSRLGLPFEAIAPVFDETPQTGENAEQTARRLAAGKAVSLRANHPASLIIGSDQVALLRGRQLGKPGSLAVGVEMLRAMSGHNIEFYTALALLNTETGRLRQHMDITRVTMRRLSDRQIERYLQNEPDALHCAGAAKSEGLGGALIERIDSSDPNALIGLPLFALVDMLLAEGVEILG